MIADYDPPVTILRPRDLARLFIVHAPGNMVFAVDIGFNLTMIGLARWTALIGLATLLALPARAQTSAPGGETPDAGESVSLDDTAIFEITPVSGTLKETVQQGQELVWRARTSPNDRRFQVTNISVALLREGTAGHVKMTFARRHFIARLSPGRRGKVEHYRSHQRRRVDLFLELRHFREVLRQQPAGSAHRTDPERPRHQCLHQCRQRGNCRIQGAELSQYQGSALSLTQRFGAAAGSDRAHDHRDGLAGLTARNPFKN